MKYISHLEKLCFTLGKQKLPTMTRIRHNMEVHIFSEQVFDKLNFLNHRKNKKNRDRNFSHCINSTNPANLLAHFARFPQIFTLTFFHRSSGNVGGCEISVKQLEEAARGSTPLLVGSSDPFVHAALIH